MSLVGNNPDYPDILIVVTDGRSNDIDETWRQAIADRAQGIQIIAVGVGPNVRVRELHGMASFPVSSNIFSVDDFQSLDDIIESVVDTICDGEYIFFLLAAI